MKVTLRNLIYGLLVLGLPLAVTAQEETEKSTQNEEQIEQSIEQNAKIDETTLGLRELEDVIETRLAHQEVLRESLRAWTDAAEAAQIRRNSALPRSYAVLARN